MKIALVQLDSGGEVEANLAEAERLIVLAASQGAELIATPEVMHLRVGRDRAQRYRDAAERIDHDAPGPITRRFANLARELSATILLGSIGETPDPPDAHGRIYNTSVLLGPAGQVVASYRKAHLFDVEVDQRNADRESDRYLAGDRRVVAQTPMGLTGLSICYDLRFPELYRAMALDGARAVIVPANFTKATGEAHWMTLLRARAIENGLFVIAPAQCGQTLGGFEAFGHSTVIDPWGRVICEMADEPGVSVVEVDLTEVDRVRRVVPALRHRRPGVYEPGR